MKLLILEDEILLAQKYQQYVQHLFDEVVVTHSYHDALKYQDCDLYLVDYHLPDGNGLDLVRKLRQLPTPPVVILITAHSKERLAIEGLNLGVFRYLEKPVEKALFIEAHQQALEQCLKQQRFHQLNTQFSLLPSAIKALKQDHFLTDREIEVLEATLLYDKNKSIGDKLNLSPGTVRNHLSNVFQKLHVSGKDELREKIVALNGGEAS